MTENASARKSGGHANASIRSRALGQIPATLQALNSPLTEERRLALTEAVRSFDDGSVSRPQDTGWVNVLARTFFSYSFDSFSPARLAWEAVIRGLSVIGCADVDNLGALGEMQAAGDALGIRATVSLETTVHVQSYDDRELNIPGRPGFMRALGVGFTRVPELDTEAGRLVASLPERSRSRNTAMIARINPILAPVTVDYEAEVLPLTPADNAELEHIAAAYTAKAKTLFPELPDLAVYWADVLGRSPTDVETLLGDAGAFRATLHEKLCTLGDSGDWCPGDYPGVTDFFRAVEGAGAVPCLYWQDSETVGEADVVRLLDDAIHWGVRAVAVAPDPLWNIPDAEVRERRLGLLAALVAGARERGMMILAGSPMNGPRQKFVDSFDAPELSAYFRDFTDGAFWLYGHATLQRALRAGVGSEWCEHAFGRARADANAFYVEVGKKAAPGKATRVRIATAGPEANAGDILEALAPLKIGG
ncbi:MAG: hypothetical protein LUE17_15445 [Planctomycetaceae bacterium]|nr:hypothetical protein [Planctomycetaceae bacterium]